MTYAQLAKTFEILAKHNPDGYVFDWAEHDEWGIVLENVELTPSEIRMLAEMGWGLGSDYEYDEEEMAVWDHPDNNTDEKIVEVFNNYKSIYKCA